MVRLLLSILIIALLPQISFTQNFDLVYGNASKEKVIENTKFATLSGDYSEIDLIRIDHAGVGSGNFIPLLISSRYILLGPHGDCEPIKLTDPDMKQIADFVLASNTQISKAPNHTYGTIRVTYRINKIVGQYFIGTVESSVEYLKLLRDLIYKLDPGYYPIVTYNRFLGDIGLFRQIAIKDDRSLILYRSIHSDSLVIEPNDGTVSFPIQTFLKRKKFYGISASHEKCGVMFWILPLEMSGLVSFVGVNPLRNKSDSLRLIVEKHDCGKKGFGNSQYVVRGDSITYARKFEVILDKDSTEKEYLVQESSFNFNLGATSFLERSKRVGELKEILLYKMPYWLHSSKSGIEYQQAKVDLAKLLNPK